MASNLQPANPKSQSQIHVEASAIFLSLWLSRNDIVFLLEKYTLSYSLFSGIFIGCSHSPFYTKSKIDLQ